MTIRSDVTAALLLLASAGQTAAKIAIPASLRGADALFDQSKVVQVQETIAVDFSDALDMLLGDKCVALNKEVGDSYEELLADYTDEEIIEWSCNDLQRKKSMKRVKAKEMDLGTQTDPCVQALEEIIAVADFDGIVDAELGDKAACSEDVGFLLNALRNALDSPQFVEVDAFFSVFSVALTAGAAIGAAAAAGAAAAGPAGAILAVAVVVPIVPPPP